MDISFKLNIRILEEEKKSWIFKKKRKFAVFCDSPFLILIYTVEIYIFCELYLYMYIIARDMYNVHVPNGTEIIKAVANISR